MKNLGIILSLLALILVGYNFFGQPKIAYVNSQDVISKYKGAKEANAKFEEESKKWQKNVQTLQAELDSLNAYWVANNKKMKKAAKKAFAQNAQKKTEDFQRYSQAVQQKAVRRQQELMNPIYADLNKYIEEYAEANGYDMVFGTLNGNIVYAEKTMDITKEITIYVNEQY
jgi:outer membrane protein